MSEGFPLYWAICLALYTKSGCRNPSKVPACSCSSLCFSVSTILILHISTNRFCSTSRCSCSLASRYWASFICQSLSTSFWWSLSFCLFLSMVSCSIFSCSASLSNSLTLNCFWRYSSSYLCCLFISSCSCMACCSRLLNASLFCSSSLYFRS